MDNVPYSHTYFINIFFFLKLGLLLITNPGTGTDQGEIRLVTSI